MLTTPLPTRALRALLPLAGITLGLMAALPAHAQTYPTVIVFEEVSPSLAPIYTGPIAPMLGGWSVAKFIANASGVPWTDFHITLQVLRNGSWVDSGEGDGISFDQPTPYAQWLNGVRVDINGVFVNGWHVDRTNAPIDMLDFFFDNFVVPPGATLSLHFDMADTIGDNTWRLQQTPTVPEPSIYALFALGLAGIGFARRRLQSRQA